MSTKRCSYRGCDSSMKPNQPTSVTFFSFPKDPERCKLWLKLGGCRGEIPFTSRFFCSKHFDEAKYVANNQRRKQLLSTAIPFPYNEPSSVEMANQSAGEDLDFQCVESTIMDDVDEEDNESISIETANEISNIAESIEDAYPNYDYQDQEATDDAITISFIPERKAVKRKLTAPRQQAAVAEETSSGSSIQKSASKRTVTSTAFVASEDEGQSKDAAKTEQYDESSLLESSTITTFIFKGQEYIQMAKDEYLGEKLSLLQKIRSYEEILKNIKHLTDDIKI